MARPLGSPNKDKPFKEALRMETLALANGEVIEHPRGSLRWNAQRLLMSGEVQSVREVADRLDGKPVQGHGQDSELGPLVVRWMTEEDNPAVSDMDMQHGRDMTNNGETLQ